MVLTRDDLAQVTRDNPYPGEPDPRFVHVVFLRADPEPGTAASLAEAEKQAAQKGSRDTAQLVGRAIFLHTPVVWAAASWPSCSGRAGGPMSAKGAGTARNWATVTKLLALCDA